LALFGRRPSVPGDSFVIPASENLHRNRLMRRVIHQLGTRNVLRVAGPFKQTLWLKPPESVP